MVKSTISGKFLVLSKDAINNVFAHETEYRYNIVQIEPSFDNDYMVEVVEKGSGITMVPVSNDMDDNIFTIISKIFKNKCGDKE